MAKATKTINRLHFSDLDPLRFEDLCLNLVTRLHIWKEINHFGRKGKDGGVDIHAIQQEGGIEKIWVIQCKRYLNISKPEIKEIIDKLLLNPKLPDKLLLVVSCDVSKTNFQYFKDYSTEKGIAETEIWTASTIEAKLYKDFKDLLFVYFGLRIETKSQNNIAKIKHSLKMEKRILKELIDHKFIKEKNNSKYFLFRPYERFISQTVVIRSVDDKFYPNFNETPDGQIDSWFQIFLYNTYHNGIEFCLDQHIGTDILIDENDNWEAVRYEDRRKSDPKYRLVKAKTIAKIPYCNIIELKINGDEYKSVPHLFCKFDINGEPYEEIYYKSKGDPDNDIPDWEFDKQKETKFTQE